MKERTWAIYVLFILAIIAGILALLDAARYMGWLPIAQLGELNFALPNAYWLGALLEVLVGIIWFVVAKWIWDLNESGRLFILVISVVNLIILVLAILGQTSFSAVALQVLVNVVALVLALLPSTEEAFRGPQM
jgi:hypothetical protein